MGPLSPIGDFYPEPPCPTCLFWRPVVNAYLVSMAADGRTFHDGVTMCHAPDQQHDFSCYRERRGQ